MFKLVPTSNQSILPDRLSYLLKDHVSEFESLNEAIENAKMITERDHIEILVCDVVVLQKYLHYLS